MRIFKSISIFITLFLANSSEIFGKPINEKITLVKKSNLNLESVNNISYEESLSEINNPYRGIFRQMGMSLKRNGQSNAGGMSSNSILRILVDMSDFQNDPLDEKAISFLKNQFENFKKNQKTVVIRFAYDPGFNGGPTKEPKPIENVLAHQEALKKVLTDYDEVIAAVECGLYGKWGEMHGSDIYAEAEKTAFVNKTIDKWLAILPKSITLNVRTPTFYSNWANIKINEIDQNITTPDQPAYRVGLYNDGYLGTHNDIGTYQNREKEIKWLSNQTKHTLFGGEFGGYDDNNMGNVRHTAAYMIEESYKTHTSYLNNDWYDKTINQMKSETYSGKDKIYEGQSGFKYIENHLGYRFVVRGVRLTKTAKSNGLFGIEVDIENVGFGNLIKPKSVTLIMQGNDNKVYKLTEMKNSENTNPNQWESQTIKTFKSEVLLPKDMTNGDYKVYLRIASRTDSEGMDGYPIRFANNDGGLWDSKLGGNYLGKFTVNGVAEDVPHQEPIKETVQEPVKETDTTQAEPEPKPESIKSSPSILKFMGTIENNEKIAFGIPRLRKSSSININRFNGSKGVQYHLWFVDSENKPSIFNLSMNESCENGCEPSKFCLDISSRKGYNKYNYISIVECTKVKHKFMYGGIKANTIDAYDLNGKHVKDSENNNLCISFTNIPQLDKCEKEASNMKFSKSKAQK